MFDQQEKKSVRHVSMYYVNCQLCNVTFFLNSTFFFLSSSCIFFSLAACSMEANTSILMQ